MELKMRNTYHLDIGRTSKSLTAQQSDEINAILKKYKNDIRNNLDRILYKQEKKEIASTLGKKGYKDVSNILKEVIVINAPPVVVSEIEELQLKYNISVFALSTTIDGVNVIIIMLGNNPDRSELKKSIAHEASALAGNSQETNIEIEKKALDKKELEGVLIKPTVRSTNLTTYQGRYRLLISELRLLINRDRDLTIADFGCGFDSEKFIPVSLLEMKNALDPQGDRGLKFIAEDQIYPFYVLAGEAELPSLLFDKDGSLIAYKSKAGHLVDCRKELKLSYRSYEVRKKERDGIIADRELYQTILQVKLGKIKENKSKVSQAAEKYKLIRDPLAEVIDKGVEYVYDSSFGIGKKESIDVGIVYNVFLHYASKEIQKYLQIIAPQIKEEGYLVVGEILDYDKESVKEEIMVFKKKNGRLRRYEFIFWVKPKFDEKQVELTNCNACMTQHQYEVLNEYFRTKEYYDSGEVLGYERFNPRDVVDRLRRGLGIVSVFHEKEAVLIEFDSQGKFKKLPDYAGIKEKPKLKESIREVKRWKKRNRDKPVDGEYRRRLKRFVMDINNHNKMYSLSLNQRMVFSRIVFDRVNFPIVNVAVSSIYRTMTSEESSYRLDPKEVVRLIPPVAYHILANRLSVYEGQCSMVDNRDIRFAINVLLFDFLRHGEKRMVELLWLIGEIEKELEKTGSGRLPLIVAMQDLHGGSRRALALVGHAFGLSRTIYQRVNNLDELQLALEEKDIDIRKKDVRFIGLNDKYDRGEDPEGVFELVKWLRDIRKAKPFIGNHDFWRILSVLGVHLIPDVSKEKSHGIGYWAEQAMKHAGWGTIELDQINQRRFNAEINRVNITLQSYGLPLLQQIDIGEYRTSIDREMMRLKKKNAEIRRENEFHKDDPYYAPKKEKILPDIFEQTLEYLKNQQQSRNTKIDRLNKKHGLDIRHIEFQEANLHNYMDDPDVIDRTLWELKNFRLFYIDILGNIHLHNVLPMDFEHRHLDVVYKNLRGIAALEAMQEDVRHFFEEMTTIPKSEGFREKMWEHLGVVFTEINRWYSDKDAYAKPVSVKKFIECGGPAGFGGELLGASVKQFADRQSTFLMVIGHNEPKKFDDPDTPIPWIKLSPETSSGLVHIDYELSQGYKDKGAYLSFFARNDKGEITGIKQWGYPPVNKLDGRKQSDIRRIRDITLTDIEGLTAKQVEMLKLLTDGKTFMKWYRKKALKEVERLLSVLIEEAGKTGRFVKEKKFMKLQVDVYKKISSV
jgi:hypothetical protein